MADIAYYSNEDTSGTGGYNYSSDSSGVGGGGTGDFNFTASEDPSNLSAQNPSQSFNAPGDITGMGFQGVGQGPGGPSGGFGGYQQGGGFAGGGGGGGGGFGGYPQGGGAAVGGSVYGLGGAGGFGGLGFGTDLGSLAQNAGFGFGPAAGNPAGWGPDPAIVGSTADAPPIQSAVQQQDPGALTYGAQDQGAPQTAEQQSGDPQQSTMDELLGVLAGVVKQINPISSASAAEAAPEVPGSLPGSAGQPVGPIGYPGGANVGWQDPNLSAAPPSGQLSGAGSNFPGMFAGGGMVPSGLGGVASGNPPAWGPDTGGPPSGFLGDTGSGIPGMFAGGGLVPGSTGAPLTATSPGGTSTAYETSPQGTDFSPGALGGTPGSFQTPTSTSPFAGGNFSGGTVPPTDTAANLALQGVDANPPGSLAGGTGPFDTSALTGPTQRFPNTAGGAPGDITGMGVVPGTTAATTTPPVPGSPADQAIQNPGGMPSILGLGGLTTVPETSPPGTDFGPTALNAPPGSFQIPDNTTPFAGNNRFAVPDQTSPGGLRFTVTPSGPEPAAPSAPPPAQTAPAPSGGGGQQTTPAPAQTRGAPAGGGSAPAGGGGGFDQRPVDQGRRRTIGQQIFGQGGMVSQLFGGGTLGDTVGSLMAQLGIPAALIFAATRGTGSARLPMVGGARAMSGAGQGGFAPQFSRNLFPGPGLPALAGLGLGGTLLGQKIASTDQSSQGQDGDRPPGDNQGTAGALEWRPSRPTLPTATTGPVATTPLDLTGGARPGASRARPAPFGAGQAPQGTMAGANFEPGMLYPITQPGGGTQAQNFITQRGGHTAGAGAPQLDPQFASRVQQAAQAYEAETGQRATFGETGRSHEQQAEYYRRFRSGQGGRAAPPGQSRHEKGLAIDITEPRFQAWMHRNAWKFGLEGLPPSLDDPNHFQMASPVLNGIRQRQASMAQ